MTLYDENDAGSPDPEPSWIGQSQDAFDRAADALRAAWDATREARVTALESAKRAVDDLAAAVEHGAEVAQERWASEQPAAEEGENEPAGGASEPSESDPDQP